MHTGIGFLSCDGTGNRTTAFIPPSSVPPTSSQAPPLRRRRRRPSRRKRQEGRKCEPKKEMGGENGLYTTTKARGEITFGEEKEVSSPFSPPILPVKGFGWAAALYASLLTPLSLLKHSSASLSFFFLSLPSFSPRQNLC